MGLRTDNDKGEVDGYFGLLDMEAMEANPAAFKKIATPEGMKTTLRVAKGDVDWFIWTCVECGEFEETLTFKRPFHTCNPEIKAKFKARQESMTLVSC